MSWLIFVAIAVIFDAVRIFTDNYISDVYFKGRDVAAQKLFSAWGKTILGIVILIISGFNFTQFDTITIILLITSGFLLSIAEVAYYTALGIEDSTNIGIFIQLAPVLYLVFGWLFLGDTFSPIQLLAIAIILVAPIMIVLTSKKRSRKVKLRAVTLAFIYILITIIANIIYVRANSDVLDLTTIIQEVSIVILGTGIMDFVFMYTLPSWRKRFHHVLKTSKNKVFVPLTVSLVSSTIKNYAYRTALVLAPAVALASAASDSVEPIVIFFMGIVLTLIWPKFGREKLDKKTVLVHFVATIFVVIGIILMQL